MSLATAYELGNRKPTFVEYECAVDFTDVWMVKQEEEEEEATDIHTCPANYTS
jgi:hypothetical protein